MEKIIYLYACDISISYGPEGIVEHGASHNNEFDFLLAGDPPEQCTRIPICLGTRVSGMAQKTIDRLGDGNTIKALRILSHGAPGTVSIGENISALTHSRLSPLRGKFSPESEGVFLYGCRIASRAMPPDESHIRSLTEGTCSTYYEQSGSPETNFESYMQGQFGDRRGISPLSSIGFTFICNLAEVLGVNVTAAIDRQTDSPLSVDGVMIDSTGYEGRYVTVTPSGEYTRYEGRSLREVFTSACSQYQSAGHH